MMDTSKQVNSALSWIVVLGATLFFFYEFIQMNMFNAIDDQLLRDFSLDATRLGRLSGYFFDANVLFLFLAGPLLDRFSTRKLILGTMALAVVATAFFAFTHSIVAASVYRFLTGIGGAFCFLATIRLATRWFTEEHMAFVTGIIFTMAMLGGMVAQTPLTLLVNEVGWRYAMVVNAGLGFVLLLLIFVLVRDYPQNYAENYSTEHQKLNAIGYWKSWRLVFLKVRNWLGGVYACLLNLPLAVLGGMWGIPYLTVVHKLSITQASYVTSMLFLGTIVGSPVMGWFSDRIRRRRLPMIVGAILSLGVIFIILYTPHLSLSGLLVLFLVLGFITSTQVVSYPTVAENNPSMLTATAVSTVSLTVIGGYAVFQPLFGWLMDISSGGVMRQGMPYYSPANYSLPMLIIPIGFVVGLVAVLFMRETYCKRLEP